MEKETKYYTVERYVGLHYTVEESIRYDYNGFPMILEFIYTPFINIIKFKREEFENKNLKEVYIREVGPDI